MTASLAGKTALVTGGSRNIGRETALALARRGADVIITYRERQETVKEIEQFGVRARALQADLTGTTQLPSLVDDVRTTLSDWNVQRLHILVNNAGILRLPHSTPSPRTTSTPTS